MKPCTTDAGESEAKRERLFGSNKLRKGISLKGASLLDLLLEECQQEASVLVSSCAIVSVRSPSAKTTHATPALLDKILGFTEASMETKSKKIFFMP